MKLLKSVQSVYTNPYLSGNTAHSSEESRGELLLKRNSFLKTVLEEYFNILLRLGPSRVITMYEYVDFFPESSRCGKYGMSPSVRRI